MREWVAQFLTKSVPQMIEKKQEKKKRMTDPLTRMKSKDRLICMKNKRSAGRDGVEED
jgi:hypothetical protein